MLWENVAEYRAREEHWYIGTGFTKPAFREMAKEDRAEQVIEIETLFDEGYRSGSANPERSTSDPAALAARLDLGVEQLADHPLGFIEEHVRSLPWEITQLVITTAARPNPRPILEYVENEERQV